MADSYPLFSIFAFCGFVAGLVPFAWHLQAWNAATCAYMLWTSLSSLIYFVDSIVWHHSINDPSPVWCDISTKFLIGAAIGVPASSLCINRRLFKIASGTAVRVSPEQKRRAVIIDLSIAVGIPVLVMVLHYIVQGHRYNIIEDIGCTPTVFNTAAAYPLVYMWPPLLGCIAFVFAFLTLRAFWKRRVQFNELLSSTNSMTVNRYFRLMLLACLEMMLTIPLSAYGIYINTYGLSLAPWVSWSDTHYNFSHVEIAPAVLWRTSKMFTVQVELDRWIYPCSALLFFALFGFAQEARRHYRAAFWWVAGKFGYTPRAAMTYESTSSSGFFSPRSAKFSMDYPVPAYIPPQKKGSESSESFATFSELEKGGLYTPITPSSTFEYDIIVSANVKASS